ncbi:DUF6531 domain-containing protein [Aquimarina rhabdastrellae]
MAKKIKTKTDVTNDVAIEEGYADQNYFEQVSTQTKLTVGKQVEGLSNATKKAGEIASNDNLSTSTKATAQLVNAVDAGVQAFGALTGMADSLSEAVLLPILQAIGLSGIASLPISKQMDPVMGIDVHMVTIPPSPAPIPMPHPYIGMLMRPKDFIAAAVASFIPPPPAPPEGPAPGEQATDEQQKAATVNQALTVGHTVATMAVGMMGATVKIGGFIPRVVAGTPTKSIPHFPMGTGFHPAFAGFEKNHGHAFLGSLLALADGDPISGGGVHLHNNCWDIGIISPHTMRKSENTDDKGNISGIRLYAPSGMITPIPMAKSILTNPVPAPFNPMAMLQKAAKGSFGRLFSKFKKSKTGHTISTKKSKASEAIATKLHDKVNKKIKSKKLKNTLHKAICTVTGHPVDVASGMFFTDEEDFFIKGPIPLSWERTWYSKSDYQGPLGNGWHHNYDIGMIIDKKEGYITLRLNDGRPIAFEIPNVGLPSFNKAEQLTLYKNEEGAYYVWNQKEELFYYFTTNTYDEIHLIRSIVNRNSFSIQFSYNSKGHLIQIKDSAHRILQLTNDTDGRILKIETSHPSIKQQKVALATYTYDEIGNMIQQTNAVGDSMYFEYQDKLMVKEIWRNGLTWHFRYDGTTIGSRCIHTWGDGDIYNHKLTFYKGETHVENSLKQTTIYHHKNGLVYKKINSNKTEEQWRYDNHNQLLSKTDPLGNTHLYSYDDLGNPIQQSDPMGASFITEYANQDLPYVPTEAVDANGGKWSWKYDTDANVVSRSNPKGATSKMTYKDGLLSTITNALDNTTTLSYNEQYEIVEICDSQNNITSYSYDDLGRCIEIKNPKGVIQKRTYDEIGRIIKVHDFDGNTIHLEYDGIDNLIKYKDDQQEVSYKYKGMWKLSQRTDQRGTTRYRYNTEEQLVEILNEKNIPYQFTLDSVGNVIKERSFDQTVKQFTRDAAGRVTQLTKASGVTTQYTYDKANRITNITHGIDHQEEQRFEYNQAGALIKAINEDAIVILERDILGQITQETINDHSITHQYNAIGQRISLESSMGALITYEHDTFGNLAKLTAQQDQNHWQAQYQYDSLGFETERSLPGHLKQRFNYDALGRLTQQQTTRKQQQKHKRRYTWGINDRLYKINDSKHGETSFGYTATGHLEFTQYENGDKEFRKADTVGNLYDTVEKNDRQYTHGGRLEKKGNWHYKYDDEGFLIEKYKGTKSIFSSKTEHWKYQWNAQGMLVSVKRPDGHLVHFTYDALGRRLSKTFKTVTTKWLWNGNVPLHEWKEDTASGRILGNSAVDENGIITWVFEADSFIPTAKLKNNKKYSIFTDQLGTPTHMYNDEGGTIWERSLDSFGKLRHGNHDSCPFMYQGQYYDPEIELAYNRFRYYDPNDGRYISVDPIGLMSGEHGFYNYVDNPNGLVDLFGLKKGHYNNNKAKKLANREARRLREEGSRVRVVTVVVHKKTGKSFIGHSGTQPKVNSRLKNQLPKTSSEIWTVNNCAEVDAYNQGMNKIKGSMPSDFTSYTVQVSTGAEKPACRNCATWVPK